MLQYHPATDFYHCWLRFAAVLSEVKQRGVEFDRLRIIDYYLCFPREILSCRIPATHSAELRKLAKKTPVSYEDPYSIRQAFLPMGNIQRQVAMDMVAKGVVDNKKYVEGILLPNTKSETFAKIENVVTKWHTAKDVWHQAAIPALLSFKLNGQDGLKHRSGLLEYKYDQ